MSETDFPHRRSAKDAAHRMAMAPAEGSAAIIQRELQAVVKWHLAREANAANIIQHLSYRVDQGSELAQRARGYGAKLKLLVARIDALLPAEVRASDDATGLGVCSEAVIHSLSAEEAEGMLVQFLRHHAQTPCVVLMHAGERLRSKGFERLWKRVVREREKIAEWIEQEQRHVVDTAAPVKVAAREGAPARPAADAATGGARPSDDETGDSPGRVSDLPRILYNPPQIVRWM